MLIFGISFIDIIYIAASYPCAKSLEALVLVKQRILFEDDEMTRQLHQSIISGDAFPFIANTNE